MKKLLLVAMLFIASCGPLSPTFETDGGNYHADNIDPKVEVEQASKDIVEVKERIGSMEASLDQTPKNSWFKKYTEASDYKASDSSIKTVGVLPTPYTGSFCGYRIVSKKRYKSHNQSFTFRFSYLRLYHLTKV